MLFSDALKKFQLWKSVRNERASITYVWEVNKFKKYIDKELNNVTIDDITEYQVHLKKTKADATQAIAAQALRSFFAFTNKRSLTDIDTDDILVTRVEEKVPVYVTQDEFEALCNIAKYQSPTILLAVRLLWFTAVRVSELCDIQVAQIDLIEKCAQIQTRKAYKPKQIFWDDETHELMQGLIKYNKSPYLFSSNKGTRLTPRTIERWIKELVRRAEFKKHITPHSFRHGATKEWLNNKVDLPAIKDFLGHKSLMSIEKYTKRLDDDIKEKGREAVRARTASIKYNLKKLVVGD